MNFAKKDVKMDLIELFHKGGDIMWVIFIGLILESVIILERALYFRLISYPFANFEKILKNRIAGQKDLAQMNLEFPDLDENSHILANAFWRIKKFFYENSPFYKIGKDYLDYSGHVRASREQAIQRHSVKLISQMERFIRLLATIANVMPLIGLLGTVAGLIKAFQKIASLGGTVDVNQLAGGIYEAMLTTAFGLIVAVPAYVAFDFYERMVGRRVDYMNFTIQHLEEASFQQEQFAALATQEIDSANP